MNKLVQEINLIICQPLGLYFQRPTNLSGEKNPTFSFSPFSPESFLLRSTKIQQLFVQLNLSLISARYCKMSLFYRNPPADIIEPEDFDRRNLGELFSGYACQRGVHHGFVQWIRNLVTLEDKSEKSDSLDKEKAVSSAAASEHLPCWLEMDSCTLSLYEQVLLDATFRSFYLVNFYQIELINNHCNSFC